MGVEFAGVLAWLMLREGVLCRVSDDDAAIRTYQSGAHAAAVSLARRTRL